MSIYDLGGEAPTVTTEHNHKTMISDAFNLQWENKVNKAEHYGNESIGLSAAQPTITMVWQTFTLMTTAIVSAPTFGIQPTPYSG